MATADKEMENSNAVTDIRAFNVDDVSANPQKPIDVNRYATKKTIAQGMLDIALLTANASQLKYILQVGEKHEFYTLMLVLISTSIVLQVLMGVLFLSLNLMRDCRLHLIEYKSSALIINHIAMGMSFAVTAINLLISAFDPGLGRFVPPTSLLDSPSISSLDSVATLLPSTANITGE
ncbi:ninjurin-2 isoform X1 [Diaphorina citri]|uniref:Ninjurin-2 isoform X1 n=1 Tax=Diaphorina citri TaxID=121845 RepID=A0A1S3D6J8_DIACI|nr:ninjurin-2 isoform X1 [Diaphorina citri]